MEGPCHQRQLEVGNVPSELSSVSTLELCDLNQTISTSLPAIKEKGKCPRFLGRNKTRLLHTSDHTALDQFHLTAASTVLPRAPHTTL